MKALHCFLATAGTAACGAFTPLFAGKAAPKTSGERPNIILIMVDDMGYSDIGCYGSEIPTPNIDRLAQSGVRYTQFYNTARSCPTRASLLTGLYPHQAGIGEMSEDPGNARPRIEGSDADGYLRFLNHSCVTMGEVLGTAGYHTYMTGKWHVGMYDESKWPLQRGFDRFYGILAGATSYLAPFGGRGLWEGNEKLPVPEPPYYTTDAFTSKAIEFIDSREDSDPFFLYLAFNAPHWPLHAKEEDIALFKGKYDCGWHEIQKARHQRQIEMGLVKEDWGLAEWENRRWEELNDHERSESSKKMEVYAAQIYCVDYNIGRLLDYLEKNNLRDNTLIVFLADNGACAENYSELGMGSTKDINDPNSTVAPSYGKPWAQVSNTPYRKYKVRAYEGGISTPLILSWPEKWSAYDGEWRTQPGHIIDIMATFVDVSGANYPEEFHGGRKIQPLEGHSLCNSVADKKAVINDYIYGEHFDNRFIRHGDWKAVWDQQTKKWELYDIKKDRTERHDIGDAHPMVLRELIDKWLEWAETHKIYKN